MTYPDWIKPVNQPVYPDWIKPVASSPSAPEGVLQELNNSSLVSGINQLGGTVARGLEYAGAGIVDAPVAAANYLNQKVAGAFGVPSQNVPTPDLPIPNPQNLPMPQVSQQNQNALDPYAQLIGGALLAAQPARDLVNLGAAGAKAIASKLTDLSGFNADSKATDFVKGLIGNQQAVKAAFREAYGDVDNAAAQRGYDLLPNSTQKPIDGSSYRMSIAGMSPDDRTAFINKMPGDYQTSFNNFNNKPSYTNAHALQSDLGSFGVKLLNNRDTAMLGRQVLGVRNALNQDIANSFDKYGDNDLTQMRAAVTQQYAENENRLLLAQKLKSGIQDLPGQGITANAQKVINAYGKAGFKKLIGRYEPPIKTAASNASIADIMQSVGRRDAIQGLMRNFRLPLIAGLGFGGYHVGKQFL